MNKYRKEYCEENGLVSINAENVPLSEYIEHLENKLAHTEQLILSDVSQQREVLIAFLEMNNWLSLEDEENAKGVVDCYLKAINCG